MTERKQKQYYRSMGEFEQNVPINNNEDSNMAVEDDDKLTFWDKVNDYSLETLLQGLTRNLNFTEIEQELKNNDDAICMYRFASNYNGGMCKGYLISGICLYHWHNLGISFIEVSTRVLDNVNTGSSRIITNRLTPYFINTHGIGSKIMAPIARSIRREDWINHKDALVSLLSVCYTQAFNADEATAMAKGFLTLIFGTDPEIITLRNVWISKQKTLARAMDPTNIYQIIIQEELKEAITHIVRIDDLSIFDTPFLLSLNASTFCHSDRTTNFSNPATVSMFQLEDKNIGVFSIVGPIVYAPVFKNQYKQKNDSSTLIQQHLITYANIAGVTSTSKCNMFPMVLSSNELFLINIPKSKPFSNDYWSKMGTSSAITYSKPAKIPRSNRLSSSSSGSSNSGGEETGKTGKVNFKID